MVVDRQHPPEGADLKAVGPGRFYNRLKFQAALVLVVCTVGAIATGSLAIFGIGLAGAGYHVFEARRYRRKLEHYGPDDWRFSWTGTWRKIRAKDAKDGASTEPSKRSD